ncbi:MAG: type VI secretion system baseplate subunit TssE [Nitrospirales bacterium]
MKLSDPRSRLSPSVLDRLLSADHHHSSPLFSIFDLLNPSGWVALLRKADSPISKYLKDQCSAELSAQMEVYDIANPVPGVLQEKLVEVLNRLVDGSCVYNRERFEGIKLSEEVIRLYEEKPKGRGLMYLNRMFLEDAYPRHLRSRRIRETPYSLQQLKQSVSRDIEALLNTRRELLTDLPSEYQELQRSLLMYGLPDFTTRSLQNQADRKTIRREIEQSLSIFEPRLRGVKVRIEDPKKFEQALYFRIDALLRVEPNPEAVSFDAVLQLSTAKYEVKSQ